MEQICRDAVNQTTNMKVDMQKRKRKVITRGVVRSVRGKGGRGGDPYAALQKVEFRAWMMMLTLQLLQVKFVNLINLTGM